MPHQALYGSPPSYTHLRSFGCRCYLNLSSMVPHKLAPRSTECIFLGYPKDHKGYRCLDLRSNKIIISRHVVFDELLFPFASSSSIPTSYFFLDDIADGTDGAPVGAPTSPCCTSTGLCSSSGIATRGNAPAALAPHRATHGSSPNPDRATRGSSPPRNKRLLQARKHCSIFYDVIVCCCSGCTFCATLWCQDTGISGVHTPTSAGSFNYYCYTFDSTTSASTDIDCD